jgi:predicted type IV restriction endonuclease
MSETDLSRAIRNALTAKGCLVIRIQSGVVPVADRAKGKRYVHCAPLGTPDLLVIRDPAVYTWLEVKTEDGALNRFQQGWHERAVSRGIRVATVRSISEAIAAVFSTGRELALRA